MLYLIDQLKARKIPTQHVAVGSVTAMVNLVPPGGIETSEPKETRSMYEEFVGKDAARLIEKGLTNDLV